MYNFIFFLEALIVLLHSPSGIEADQCPYIDVSWRSTSAWADFTDMAEFVSISEDVATNQVLTQLSELKGVIDSFKVQYVSMKFWGMKESIFIRCCFRFKVHFMVLTMKVMKEVSLICHFPGLFHQNSSAYSTSSNTQIPPGLHFL